MPLTPGDVLRLQRMVGNAAAGTLCSPVVQRLTDPEQRELEGFYQKTIREIGDPFARRNWQVYRQARGTPSLDEAKELIRTHVANWHRAMSDEARDVREGESTVRGPKHLELPTPPLVRFHLALNQRMRMLLATVRFGAAAEMYNPDFWERGAGEDRENLYLRAGRTPADAIAELHRYSAEVPGIEGQETAKLDCVEIIEVGRWLAELDVVGQQRFNEKYGGGEFVLSAPGSTGIQGESLAVTYDGIEDEGEYFMGRGGGPFDGMVRFDSGPRQDETVLLAPYLATLPVGSRVMWRNFDDAVPDDDDCKNENTVKLGDDSYAAHPFGVFGLADLATVLARGRFEDIQTDRATLREDLNELRTRLASLKSRRAKHEFAILAAESAGESADKSAAKVKKLKQKIKAVMTQIKETVEAIGEYEHINTVADYIADNIRIVEVETFAPPV